ncbi:MFS transporter [Hoeflea sp. WL0058]|uniref:MFS transporter n=1 Tax=Flavimaribacter sediminis TaxID=2865987 RepID=A0AAE3D2P3_9HYPH|nr:MFS transporter [Flavimaribacter sediminis]MBW8639352.1 MFS transporter [Flavimaribacter sediminis]
MNMLPASRRRVILSGLIGNTTEWYDFSLYGYFATVIGRQFFPADNPQTSLLAAFGAFAAGFLARPLGGVAFGRIGDRLGRKRALMLSILLMAVPTFLIGCLPTFETIGFAAPVLIVALRMAQGLSAGGEYTSSVAFLVEQAPENGRAFNAVWAPWGSVFGIMLGSATGFLLSSALTDSQIDAWGWRLPFLGSVLIAGVGYLLRNGLHAGQAAGGSDQPFRDAIGRYRGVVAKVALLNVAVGVGTYSTLVYSVSYMEKIDQIGSRAAFGLNTAAMGFVLLITPLAARLSDRIGRKPLIIVGCALFAAGAIPFLELIHGPPLSLIFLRKLGYVTALGLLFAGATACMAEMIPTAVRCTGLALAYNISLACFGGATPLIATWLYVETGNPIAPAWWIAGGGAVGLFTALFLIPETRFWPLP